LDRRSSSTQTTNKDSFFFKIVLILTTATSAFLAYRALSTSSNLDIASIWNKEAKPTITNSPPNIDCEIQIIPQIVEKLANKMGGDKKQAIDKVREKLDPDNKYNLQYFEAMVNNQQKEKRKWVKLLNSFERENNLSLQESLKEILKENNQVTNGEC